MQHAFQQCTSLSNVNLPSLSSIGVNALNYAFFNCISLKYVNLKNISTTGNLQGTFEGCSSLVLLDMSKAQSIPGYNATLTDTNNTFKIVVPDALYSSWKTQSGWSLYGDQLYPVSTFTLKFTAEGANSTVGMVAVGNAPSVNLETSSDGTTWTPYTVGNTITLANIGDYVMFRATSAKNTTMATDDANYNHFVVTGTVSASGNVMAVLDSSFDGTP